MRGYGDGSIAFEHKKGFAHKPGPRRDPENKYHKGCTGRWRGSLYLGRDENGKVRRLPVTARSKTEVEEKLKARAEELALAPNVSSDYTMNQCIDDWVEGTLVKRGRAPKTVTAATSGVVGLRPLIGKTPLRELTAVDLEKALEKFAVGRSPSFVSRALQTMRRAIRYAQSRGRVGQNVALLIDPPQGKGAGRPSKAFSKAQAMAVLSASIGTRLDWYVHLGMLHGVRTEEERALRWENVDDFDADDCGIDVIEAVRFGGDTKTEKSRRGTVLCGLAVESGKRHKARQDRERERAGSDWKDADLVFTTRTGGPLDAANVRRMFRAVLRDANKSLEKQAANLGIEPDLIDPDDWTPRELRHTFASLMDDAGVSMAKIRDEMGHERQSTTESVYRRVLNPRRTDAAKAMNDYMTEDGATS